MSITSNELPRVKSFDKRVHTNVVYAYIVENKTQAQIAAVLGFDDSWAVSAIVRAYNFNRERSDSYQGGRDKGKYRGTERELVEGYVSKYYPGFVDDDRVTFDDYLKQHRTKPALRPPAAQRPVVRPPAPMPARPQQRSVPPRPAAPAPQPIRRPTADELLQQAIRLWRSGARQRETAELLVQAAKLGHAEAPYYMALYYNERGSSGSDYAEAYAWLREAVKRGSREAKREEARFLAVIAAGARKYRDYRTVVACYEQGARAGDAEAANRLGILYAEGEGIAKDERQAAYWYDQAARGGSSHGMYNLAGCYRNGNGVEKSASRALQLYEQASGYGHAEARAQAAAIAYKVGRRFLSLMAEEKPKAYAYFQKAAQYGHPEADLYLGICHAKGIGTPVDPRQAFRHYELAARRGSAAAHNNLGVLYARGEGVTQDDRQAADHYEQAAKLGDAMAVKNLAYCYKNGKGRESSPVRALHWFEQAAGQGNAEAKGQAAEIAYGIGELLWKSKQPGEKARAFGYYRKALEYGNRQAMLKLGLCYEQGEGVEQSYEQAIGYYKQAEAAGIKDAEAWLADGYLQYGIDRYEDDEYEQAIELFEQGAALGNEESMRRLAECYFAGEGVEEDDDAAAEWWAQAAEARFSTKSAPELYMDAAVHCMERFDTERCLAWYRRAAELGHGDAMKAIGDYYSGKGDYADHELDAEQAAEWYKRAIDHGLNDCEWDLYELYMEQAEQAMRHEQFEEAYRWFLEAESVGVGTRYKEGLWSACIRLAEATIAEGRYLDTLALIEQADACDEDSADREEMQQLYAKLGDYCLQQREFPIAVQWYAKAAPYTDLEQAEMRMQDAYLDGDWTFDEDGKQLAPLADLYRLSGGDDWVQPLLAFCERAAEHHDDNILWDSLARAYETGYWEPFDVAVTPDAERAFDGYRRAVEDSGSLVSHSIYRLAHCYRHGAGTPQDPHKAAETLELLAAWHDPEALNILGEMAFVGEGMPQNLDKTFDYCSQAAELDHAEAQYNVGFCYEHGYGTTQDIAKAIEWYTKSAQQGFALAVERLDELAGS